jgi:hypothetical protein
VSSFLPLVRLWILVSAFASLAGWGLSLFRWLTPAGYGISSLLFIAALCFFRNQLGLSRLHDLLHWKRFRFRFKHALPLCFFLLSFLIFLGGALYPPTNHTAITYRIPRVLHWLAHGGWHWIHTANYRMNNRACGIEWLTAPLLLFTHSDRLLFLLNFFPFLLLPGLIFSVFTRLGVKPRVAWNWMWVLPTGYNFLLQAGSTANDTFPAIYLLAAVDFALRALPSRRPYDLWLAILSAALLTGAKASNLPLLLPCALLILTCYRLLAARPALTILVLALSTVISFVPTALLNIHYCGDWSGLNLERAGMDMKNPFVGLWGNPLLFLLHNFVPPFFPFAGSWNRSILTILPHFLVNPLVRNFEQGFHTLWELPTEDWVGLGFGVSVLLLVSICAARRLCPRQLRGTLASLRTPLTHKMWLAVLLSPWAALLVYCLKSGMVTGARLISPYYLVLVPVLLLGNGQAVLVRRAWWRRLAFALVLLAFPVIILTPGRPLWPALTTLSKMTTIVPNNQLISRALTVYTVYSRRSDPLAEVRSLLPETEIIGFLAGGDDPDISFWKPFGSRRVEHVFLNESASDLRRRHIEFVVIGGANLRANGTTIEAWLQQSRAELKGMRTATLKVQEGPQPWYVARILPN